VTRFGELLRVLGVGGARFVLVGGVAATAHGSPRSTQDLDVVYRRDDENLRRIAASLCPHHPYMRGAPPGLPFRLDFETLRSGLNFTLTTDLGWIDLLGEIAGVGGYENLAPQSITVEVFGISCKLIGLDALILAKRAAGRPKDLEDLAELEMLRERRKREAAG
jgi:hypothetical protein